MQTHKQTHHNLIRVPCTREARTTRIKITVSTCQSLDQMASITPRLLIRKVNCHNLASKQPSCRSRTRQHLSTFIINKIWITSNKWCSKTSRCSHSKTSAVALVVSWWANRRASWVAPSLTNKFNATTSQQWLINFNARNKYNNRVVWQQAAVTHPPSKSWKLYSLKTISEACNQRKAWTLDRTWICHCSSYNQATKTNRAETETNSDACPSPAMT